MIKYLTHELIRIDPYDDIFDYRCKNCNVILYQTSNMKYFYIHEKPRSIYEFFYTCDEWIIKNIIE